MRVVILSDIHGNMIALDAVINAMPASDAVYVAGDLCLDGPEPERVVDCVVRHGWQAVQGNTDRDIVELGADLKPMKTATVVWTRARLGSDRLAWLARLPFSVEVTVDDEVEAQVVHANPLNLDEHLRPDMSPDQLEPYLAAAQAPVLAFGHLHIPYVRPVGDHVLVNVASVGHPKDRDRRAAFTVLEWRYGQRSVTQVRVPYDVERAVTALGTSDMPGADKQAKSLLRASY